MCEASLSAVGKDFKSLTVFTALQMNVDRS